MNHRNKKNLSRALLATGLACGFCASPSISAADEGADHSARPYADFNLRLETVEQDNALKDATALTLRSRIGLETGKWGGERGAFSALFELEDSRPLFGINDYSVPPAGYKPGQYSVIADPPTTEIDQALVKYQGGPFTAILGRQRIVYDGARFVGDVGWRQDRQTFDAFSMGLKPVERVTLSYNYVTKRNRIFADKADIDSKDHLFNAAFSTSVGKFVAYGYLLEEDKDVKNGIDTWGVSYSGSRKAETLSFTYSAEFATQDARNGPAKFSADYYALNGGLSFKPLTLKLGYEVLGSDAGNYGFSTPLATLHKFNGWADQFLTTPSQGLEDLYVGLGGKLLGGNWAITYHDFSADHASPGVKDFGDEWDLVYTRKFFDKLLAGLKFAAYSAGDSGTGKVDTDKLWIWAAVSF